MEVKAPGIHLVSVSLSSSEAPVSFHSSSSSGGWTIHCQSSRSKKERLFVTFRREDDDSYLGEAEVHLRAGKKARSLGWERLQVNAWTRKAEGTEDGRAQGFCAYRLHNSSRSSDTLLIFSQPDTANFLGQLPDDTPLGNISLPGTHESCALYGFPISQCQQPGTTIGQQLLDGVRFLDVRLRVVGDDLLMYHGPRSQRSSLTALLKVLHAFLTAHPTETLLLSLKQETPPWHSAFSERVHTAFSPYLEKFWFLEERIPLLGEVRGKGMLLTRFDRDKETEGQWPEGMGVHPSRWPDSRREGFDWDCGGTQVRTQDWYRVKTFLQIPEKFEAITSHLHPTLLPSPAVSPPFTLSYTSASYFPLSLPTIIAKGFGWPSWGMGVEGINTRLCRWLLECIRDGKKVRGCLAMDFYRQCAGDEGLAGLLVQMNFLEGSG
ncbi:hypothetical protein IAT38_007785 [Cryptococcus sp. DSM 104549]